MISIVQEDITKIKTEAIVNSTNSLYIMNKGVSSDILLSAGKEVEDEIKNYKKKHKSLKEGDFYSTSGGNLLQNNVKIIYHAVVNDCPTSNSSIYVINCLMNKILNKAIKDKVTSITFTGLGTGCCCLNKRIIAMNMIDSIRKYCGLINITIADLDEELVNIFKEIFKGITNE